MNPLSMDHAFVILLALYHMLTYATLSNTCVFILQRKHKFLLLFKVN